VVWLQLSLDELGGLQLSLFPAGGLQLSLVIGGCDVSPLVGAFEVSPVALSLFDLGGGQAMSVEELPELSLVFAGGLLSVDEDVVFSGELLVDDLSVVDKGGSQLDV
jgi:hypothetical protein